MEQLTLFELGEETVADIRTVKQKSNKIAYDVGERMANSRKSLATLRKQFEDLHSLEALEEIESANEGLAEEVVTKKEITKKHLNKEEEMSKGVLPGVYRFKELLLQRVDSKPSIQTKEGRANFLKALQYVLNELESVYTWEDVSNFVRTLRDYVLYEKDSLSFYAQRIQELTKVLESCEKDSKLYKQTIKEIEKYKLFNERASEAKEKGLSILGERFVRFFKKSQSRISLIENARKISSWEDLEPSRKSNGKSPRKPVWERMLPERPDRIGGAQSPVTKPEDMVTFFGFRGIEYGHWVSDQKGLEHLLRSSEAFMDLAELLKVDYKAVSLDGTLGIAYGARGRGRAAAHYEPLNKVINMTKTKGCLGVLAHEFFHALDHHIYNVSHGTEDRKGFASTNTLGDKLPIDVTLAFQELEECMKKGTSISYIENTNKPGVQWQGDFISMYRTANGDLLKAMERVVEREKEALEFYRHTSPARKIQAEKHAERNIKRYALALAWYHEQVTGERVKKIPYPSNKTVFYSNAIQLDQGAVGKYWSSTVELAARSFEAYIQDKLESLGRRSDYLVAGTKDIQAYPMGEERERINEKIENLIQLIVELKILK